MDDNLRIRLRTECMPLAPEFSLKLFEIFYDPVMHKENLACAVGVRMRINLVGDAVGSPACVRNADGTLRKGMRPNQVLQILNFSFGFLKDDLTVPAGNDPYPA